MLSFGFDHFSYSLPQIPINKTDSHFWLLTITNVRDSQAFRGHILGSQFDSTPYAQMEAKGNYCLRLENPCSGRKRIPPSPATPEQITRNPVPNKYPLISRPRAKPETCFSDLPIKQLLQSSKNQLPSHPSAGTQGCALRW